MGASIRICVVNILEEIEELLREATTLCQDYQRKTEGVMPSSPYALLAMVHLAQQNNWRVSDLANKIGVTQQAVGKMLREMEKADLVTIHVDEGDRRARLVSLTKRGEAHVQLLKECW